MGAASGRTAARGRKYWRSRRPGTTIQISHLQKMIISKDNCFPQLCVIGDHVPTEASVFVLSHQE